MMIGMYILLLDRVAVVTGGNKGIGLEVCRQLASNKGLIVVLTARNDQRGASAVQKLKEAGHSNVIFHQLDTTDALSISRLADFLKSRFGRIDILVSGCVPDCKACIYIVKD
jgi:(+)-neomenthol dehydrogenase